MIMSGLCFPKAFSGYGKVDTRNTKAGHEVGLLDLTAGRDAVVFSQAHLRALHRDRHVISYRKHYTAHGSRKSAFIVCPFSVLESEPTHPNCFSCQPHLLGDSDLSSNNTSYTYFAMASKRGYVVWSMICIATAYTKRGMQRLTEPQTCRYR